MGMGNRSRRAFVRDSVAFAALPILGGCRSGRPPSSDYSVSILGDTHFDAAPADVYHGRWKPRDERDLRDRRREFTRNADMWADRLPRLVAASAATAEPVRLGDNLWFYWDLRLDAATNYMDGAARTLERARAAGYRGVMLGSGSRVALLPLMDAARRERARAFRRECGRVGLEIAVAVWSFGYGRESFLPYDVNLAAANPVFGTRYRVADGVAVSQPGERRELLPSGGGIVHSPARDGDIARQTVRLRRDRSYRIHIRGEAEGVEGAWPVLLAVRRIGVKSEAIESRVFRFRTGEPFGDFLQFASMDADREWVRLAKSIPRCDCRGMMYTQWGQGFSKLEEFASAVRDEEGRLE